MVSFHSVYENRKLQVFLLLCSGVNMVCRLAISIFKISISGSDQFFPYTTARHLKTIGKLLFCAKFSLLALYSQESSYMATQMSFLRQKLSNSAGPYSCS